MSEVCEVIEIETENGIVEINKSDYDAKVHKLAGQKEAEKPIEPVKKSAKKK